MKYFFFPLTEPLGAIWLIMAVGTVSLAWRKQWRGLAWLGVPTFLIFLMGSLPITEALTARAEAPYAACFIDAPTHWPTATPPQDAVLVLGGGFEPSAHDAYGFVLNAAASRVLTAVDLVRSTRAKNLVLGGSSISIGTSSGPVMSRVQTWIQAWHVIDVPVTNLGACANTHDEALAFKALNQKNGWRRTILVTSALHMPRAEAVFKKQGIEVTPVACDFQCYGRQGLPVSLFPSFERIRVFSRYLHEKVGWWVYRWKGWI
jgi:uncharacterized SAM-binding protein YcdF (DUF218 family)